MELIASCSSALLDLFASAFHDILEGNFLVSRNPCVRKNTIRRYLVGIFFNQAEIALGVNL
jgi:hypothetical protein